MTIKTKLSCPEPDVFIFEGIEVISVRKNEFDERKRTKKRLRRNRFDN